MSNLVKERNEAFMEAIMNDKWDKVKAYCKKYNIPLLNKSKTMKAGIYKAVQYCTDIPEEVKTVAMQKCLELGFNPLIEPYEEDKKNE